MMKMRTLCFGLLALSCLKLSAAEEAATTTIAVKSGEKIAFLGDSITSDGGQNPGGYCRLVLDGLSREGIEAKGHFAGIGGNTCRHMLARQNAA